MSNHASAISEQISRVSVRLSVGILLLILACNAVADCAISLPLQGAVSIKACDSRKTACVPASEALHKYFSDAPDSPDVLTIALQGSPWRLYDGELRIIGVDELASMIGNSRSKAIKRVELLASWSAVAPEPGQKSLVQKLSRRLDGFPVQGVDGFLWMDKKGGRRTTRQAVTIATGAVPYTVAPGDEVMASFAVGWPATLEKEFLNDRNAEGVFRAGVGWDVFSLCPERSLSAFEAAAKLSHPIAAYNAAIIRLERGAKGDLEAVKVLLLQAANAGDKKSADRLRKINGDVR